MRRKEEKCTGNLTSLFHSLSLGFLFLPYHWVDQGRESSVCPTSSATMSACFVCSLPIFRVPLSGEFPVCRGSSPFFLNMPLPLRAYGTRLRTYTPNYRSFPSYSRGVPRVVGVRERKRESQGLFRGGFPFSHLWVPPYPHRVPTPYPRGDTIIVEWGAILGHFDDYPPCSRIPLRWGRVKWGIPHRPHLPHIPTHGQEI